MRSRDWVPGVAAILFLLQLVRNAVPPFADLTLSFDGDIALHLLLGEQMLTQGTWLATEPTNFLAPDAPFIAHEWLAEVVLALSHRAFGLAGPILLTAVLVASLSVAMLRRALRAGAGMWPAVVTVVAAVMVQNTHLHPRPHLVTWLFGFWFVCWLDDHRTGALSTRAWWLRSAALVVLWAQLHAGFLAIALLLLAFGVGALLDALGAETPGPALRRARDVAVGGAGLLLVSGLNPWGFALHAHFLAWLGNDYMTSFTTEFQSPDFRGMAGWILLAYMALLWLGLAGGRQRPATPWLLLTLGLNAMALYSARHGALFATLTAPFVAARLQDALAGLAALPGTVGRVAAGVDASSERLGAAEAALPGRALMAAGVVATTVLVGVLHTPQVRFHPDLQPVAAVDWLEAHPDAVHGRMFNPFRWGAYLAWRLYPTHQVFMNSWHDHLGEDALRTYFQVHDVTPEWEKVLKQHQVEWVIYETGSPLGRALDDDESWQRVHQDATASVWVRQRTAGR